jgi:hypothetical protein
MPFRDNGAVGIPQGQYVNFKSIVHLYLEMPAGGARLPQQTI